MNATYSVPCIYPLSGTCEQPLSVTVPGSKSITNRALLLSTLAEGPSVLRGALFSDDSRHFLKCIQELGFDAREDEAAGTIQVTGMGSALPKSEASLYVGSAGTAARFLTARLGVSDGAYHLDASEQMRRRPMMPLLNSLEELGCDISFSEEKGFFPFTLRGHGFHKEEISVDIKHSSQFLSALLICACLSGQRFTIHVKGTHGMAYIHLTCEMMRQFGVEVSCPSPDTFIVEKNQRYHALDYRIEPDVSAACYFYALTPLLSIPVLVRGVHFDSLQGDTAFLRILEQTGCTAAETDDGILLKPSPEGTFHGVDTDMSACSDQAITLAAIAPFADSPTTIRGIGHIRFQESDRITAMMTELRRMGIRCEEREDGLTIYPGTPLPALLKTYEDHRMAMGFALTGLRAEGIVIDNPTCCRKTFETYFDVLDQALLQLRGRML